MTGPCIASWRVVTDVTDLNTGDELRLDTNDGSLYSELEIQTTAYGASFGRVYRVRAVNGP